MSCFPYYVAVWPYSSYRTGFAVEPQSMFILFDEKVESVRPLRLIRPRSTVVYWTLDFL